MIVSYATGLSNVIQHGGQGQFSFPSPHNYSGVKEGFGTLGQIYDKDFCRLDFPPQSELGISFCVSFTEMDYSWDAHRPIVSIVSSEDEAIFRVDPVNSNGRTMSLEFYNDTTWVVGATKTASEGVIFRFDIAIKIDAVNGYVKVYCDDELLVDHTGNTTKGGFFSDVAAIRFGAVDESTSNPTNFSHVFVTDAVDADTRYIYMFQHNIDGEGRFAQMQGDYQTLSNFGGINDSTYLTTSEVGKTHLLATEDLPAEYNNYEVIAVGLDARFAAGTSDAKNIALVIDDGVSTTESTQFDGNGYYDSVLAIFPNAPDGSSWDLAKVNNTEVGVRSK